MINLAEVSTQFSRYRPLVKQVAAQAMTQARPALTPITAHADARLGLPAAHALLADAITPPPPDWHDALTQLASLDPAATDDARLIRTPGGQWRDVYHPLVIHLYLRSFARVRPTLDARTAAQCRSLLTRAAAPIITAPDTGTISFRLWRALCALELHEHAPTAVDRPAYEAAADQLAHRPDNHRPLQALHPQDDDEPLDFWTYRELAGLHALARLAHITTNQSWHERVTQITAFHLDHTQPDYTTYEPWALSAFARATHTALFADQQLHDATTHLNQSSPSAALMVALLLADASNTMTPSSPI